jgi:hypothetical protein
VKVNNPPGGKSNIIFGWAHDIQCCLTLQIIPV